MIKKLTKKGKTEQLGQYKSDVVDYNNNMKEIIEQNWPYKENGFEYMSFDQVRELKKTGKRDYAVIYCISQTPSSFQSGCLNAHGINWSWNMKYNTDDVDYRQHFTSMVVCDIEGFGISPVYTTQLPDIFPTKASVIFGVSGVTYYFDYRVKNKTVDAKMSAKKYMDKQVEENALLNTRVAQYERQIQMEQASSQETARQMKGLNEENARLQEDLAFFQNLTATRGKDGELAIHRLRLERDPMPGEYRVRMLLVQSGQRAKEFVGSYQLVATVLQNGQRTTQLFPHEMPGNAQFQLNFKYYQRVEQSIQLSPDAQLESVQVRLFEQGVREPRVRQSVSLS